MQTYFNALPRHIFIVVPIGAARSVTAAFDPAHFPGTVSTAILSGRDIQYERPGGRLDRLASVLMRLNGFRRIFHSGSLSPVIPRRLIADR